MSTFVTVAAVMFFIAGLMFMLKKGVNVGLVMLIASVGLVAVTGTAAADALIFTLNGIISEKTIKLALAIYFIMILEKIMSKTGMIGAMVSSLRNMLGSRRLAAALLPIVIGLLPSPGGARFSCPMVEDVTGKSTDQANKAFVNYWFRHVWMDGFLLYPGIILAAELSNTGLLEFFIVLLPFMVLSAGLGWLFGLRKIDQDGGDVAVERAANLKIFIKSLYPVVLVVAMYIALSRVFVYALEVSLAAVLCLLFAIKRYSFREIEQTLKKAFPAQFILIIAGVMVFRQILFDSGAVDSIVLITENYSIPVKLLYLALPFLGGLASGIAVTGVSIAFPVLVPLGLGGNTLYAVLAFTAGFVGVMATPLHLCAVLTAEYFKTPSAKLLLKVAAVQSIVFAVASVVLLIA